MISMGIRYLSSYLLSKGHSVKLVFFPFENPFDESQDHRKEKQLFEQLLNVCEKSDLIGLSLTTIQYSSCVKLTEFLQEKTGKPVIWGGIHPTLCPEDCIAHADFVCVGDGEDPLLELVEKMETGGDCTSVGGIWAKKNGEVVKNPVREIKDNLDVYPPMDYALENKWMIRKEELVPMSEEDQKAFFSQTHLALEGSKCYAYVTQASRGCPHKCAYCSNAFFLEVFKGKGRVLRRRGVNAIIDELKAVLKLYPYINAINFYDDTFFSTTDEAIVEFAQAYQKEIGLPFFVLASPLTLSEIKLTALLDAGLGHVQMGVQTGSERLNREVYRRPFPNKITMEKMKLLNKYKDRIIPQYDFIIDNPYETEEDKFENIKFLSEIPKPYKLQLFSLVFYPHTELYERAVADKIFKEELGGSKKSLAKFADKNLKSMDFYSFAVGLSPNIPGPVFKVFTVKPVFDFLNMHETAPFFRSLAKFAIKLNKRFHLTQKIIVNRTGRNPA
jgi:radical SAM superfamily enzyme YgiQ (UPF0313 family)